MKNIKMLVAGLCIATLLCAQGGTIVIEREHKHLGTGAALSPDGTQLVYVATDDSLVVRELSSGEETVLVKEAGGFEVFTSPVFSADGQKIYFAAGGGTAGHGSGIFSVERMNPLVVHEIVRSPLAKNGGPQPYEKYYYAARPGPSEEDGLAIQFREGDEEKVDVLRNGKITLLASGKLLDWIGKDQILVEKESGSVVGLDPTGTGTETVLATPEDGPYLGILGGEAVTLKAGIVRGRNRTYGFAAAARPTSPGRAEGGRMLPLRSVQQSRNGLRQVAVYDDGLVERLVVSR